MLPNSSLNSLQGSTQQSQTRRILPVKIKSHFHPVPTFVLNKSITLPTVSVGSPIIPAKLNSLLKSTSIISDPSGSLTSAKLNKSVTTSTMPNRQIRFNNSVTIMSAKPGSPIVPGKLNNLVTTSARPCSSLVPATAKFETILARPGSPIVPVKVYRSATKTARPVKSINFEECAMPEKILSEFKNEIIRVLNEPKEILAPIGNIVDIPQHLEVKMKFVTQAEMIKIELEKRSTIENQEKLLKEETEMKNKNCKVQSKLQKEENINSILRTPRCHKSTQCRLLKDTKKPIKVKKVKEEKPKCLIDKCISTADFDPDFETNFLYVPRPPEEDKLFKYLKGGNCECLKCGKVCTSSAYIKRHVQQHRERGRLCYKCGKMCKTVISCVQHESHCGGVGTGCGSTVRRGRRPRPIQTKDGKLITIGRSEKTCKYCGRRSKSIIEHLDHVNSHTGEKPHKCTCGARFGHIYNLKFHRKKFGCVIPSTDLFYGMKIIPRNEKRKVDLGESSSTSTKKVPTSSTKVSRARSRDPDRYLCKVCNLRCPDYTHFRRHRLKHITDRKFTCKTCNNCYKDLAGLKAHIKKKHLFRVCSICGQKASSDSLAAHLRMHTGEKPFICDICEDGFNCKRLLTKHKFEVHNIGKRLKCWEKHSYKCYLCKETFCAIKSFHNHLIKEKHCEKEKLWKEKCLISAFNCTYCTIEDLVRFADYAGHAGKTHNMHIYSKMEVIFKAFEELKNTDITESNEDEPNEIEDIKIESNATEGFKIEAKETKNIKTEWSEVEYIKTESNSNEYNIKAAQREEIPKEYTSENAAKMAETIKKELILEEFMDKITDNVTQENTDIKFEEIDVLDEFFDSDPEEVHKNNYFIGSN